MTTFDQMCAQFQRDYDRLCASWPGRKDLDELRQNVLEVHAAVHPAEVSHASEPTIADQVFELVRKNPNLLVPRETWEADLHYAGTAVVPIVWQFWHTYRIEDLVSNILMADQNQIFDAAWQKRIGSPITDTGNALELDEAREFGAQLDLNALHAYMVEVGRNTQDILRSLTLEQLENLVPEEWVMRILEEGGVTTDLRSVWLLVFWGRLTVWEMILTPMTNHHMMHLPTCREHLCESEQK